MSVDIKSLLLQHDIAIRQLKKSTSQMLLIWKIVGIMAGIAFTVYVNSLIPAV